MGPCRPGVVRNAAEASYLRCGQCCDLGLIRVFELSIGLRFTYTHNAKEHVP